MPATLSIDLIYVRWRIKPDASTGAADCMERLLSLQNDHSDLLSGHCQALNSAVYRALSVEHNNSNEDHHYFYLAVWS